MHDFVNKLRSDNRCLCTKRLGVKYNQKQWYHTSHCVLNIKECRPIPHFQTLLQYFDVKKFIQSTLGEFLK